MQYQFNHERLDVFRLAVEVNQWVCRAGFPRGRSSLRDQAMRASDSVVCNIAEGCSKKGTVQGKGHLMTALGSAGECCAALGCVSLPGSAEQQDKLRRIGAMLYKMSH
ncbi:MAG: four helix bundle protein [Deltaproteobacteria bacterium]|nr:four helix bundle protein [Deltaproteobacteria bacterium]